MNSDLIVYYVYRNTTVSYPLFTIKYNKTVTSSFARIGPKEIFHFL